MKRQEKIDQEFVDREPLRRAFARMVPEENAARILCVRGDAGMGKSWLLKRLHHDSSISGCPRALINCASSYAEDEYELLFKIAEEMAGPIEKAMIEGKGITGSISIESQGDTNIEGDVILNQTIVNVYGSGKGKKYTVSDKFTREKMVKTLTKRLFSILNTLQPPQKALLFLDDFDMATKETRAWLLEVLFQGLCSYEINNLMVVIASKKPFECFRPREWADIVRTVELGGMDEPAVGEYWQKRKMPAESLDFFITFLFGNTVVSPADMCDSTTRFEQGIRRRMGGWEDAVG